MSSFPFVPAAQNVDMADGSATILNTDFHMKATHGTATRKKGSESLTPGTAPWALDYLPPDCYIGDKYISKLFNLFAAEFILQL